jgi:hypothetical protein
VYVIGQRIWLVAVSGVVPSLSGARLSYSPTAYACIVAGLRDISDATFSWRPVKGVKHTIELHAGDQVFGTLRFDGVEAVAEVDGQRWAFTRHRKQVIIRDAHGTVAGTFRATKRGEGQLELTDGRCFSWARPIPGKRSDASAMPTAYASCASGRPADSYRSRIAVRPTRVGRRCRSSRSWSCSAGSSASVKTTFRPSPVSSPPHPDDLVPTTAGSAQSTECCV